MRLAMTQVNSIREFFFDKGLNIAEIQRLAGNDRKTIRNILIWITSMNQSLKLRLKDLQNSIPSRKRLFDCSYRLVVNYVRNGKIII